MMAQRISASTTLPPTGGNQRSDVQLDDDSLNTLRSLLSLVRDFRQSTSTLQRIQTGSPGANRLGATVRTYHSKFGSIAGQCQQISIKRSQFPGVILLITRLDELQKTLGEDFDDSSKGYGERVRVLEKLNYENGTLRGVVETIIEYHEFWKNKLSGQGNQPLARRLNFDTTTQQSTFTGQNTVSSVVTRPRRVLPLVTQASGVLSSQFGRQSLPSQSTITSTSAAMTQAYPSTGLAIGTQYLPSTSGTLATQGQPPGTPARPLGTSSSASGLGTPQQLLQMLTHGGGSFGQPAGGGLQASGPAGGGLFGPSPGGGLLGQQTGGGLFPRTQSALPSSGTCTTGQGNGMSQAQPQAQTAITSTSAAMTQAYPSTGLAIGTQYLPSTSGTLATQGQPPGTPARPLGTSSSASGLGTPQQLLQMLTHGGGSFGQPAGGGLQASGPAGGGLFGPSPGGGLFGQQTGGGLFPRTQSALPSSGTCTTGQGNGMSQAQPQAQTGGRLQRGMPQSTALAGLVGQQVGAGVGGLAPSFQQVSGLGLGRHAPPNLGTGSAMTSTTQSQPQRGISFKFSSSSAQQRGGFNLSALVQPTASQSSSSISVSTSQGVGDGLVLGASGTVQPSNLATTSAPQKQSNILYIPRQPAVRPNDAGQEITTSNTDSTEPQSSQSSTENCGFSLNIDQATHMCNGITDLWESKRHTDVTFLIQVARVPAHKIILASQSEYFDRLLFGEMREAHEDEIQLNDVDNVEAFQLLMNYAYSGCLDIQNGDIQDALDVLKLSDRFGFELLKNTLGDKLTAAIDIENILHLLAYADLYQVTGLRNECCTFIDQRAKDVLTSDAILTVSDHVLMLILSRDSLCVPEILVFQTVVRWKESDQANKEVMKGVLECVRLTEIPPRILFSEVEKSGLFESESIMKALRAQNLPDFELMRPRGIKCSGVNLMNDAEIDISQSESHASTYTNHVVTLNPPQPYTSRGTHLSRFSPCETLVRVTLKQECLVNTIELESPPSCLGQLCFTVPDEVPIRNVVDKKFSYKIYVSKDGKDWTKLFDYSEYDCHNLQKLNFPALAFRMFQFELTESECQQLNLRFANCSFVKDHKPFKFRENGIIAPLFPLKPLASQVKETDTDVLVIKFNQPYSVSILSFRICGPVNSVADFMVSNLTGRSLDSEHLGEVKTHPFNKQLSIEFAEQVVMSITVEIRNIKMSSENQVTTATTTDSNLRRNEQANRVGEQNYTIAGLTCQLLMPVK